MSIEGKKKVKCDVCGAEFEPTKEGHYIARLSNLFTGTETFFDAWDCPKCGRQYIGGERKERNGKRSTEKA